MAQADCLPTAMRALITGASQKSYTAKTVPGGIGFRWSNDPLSVIGASSHLPWRFR
jgi:hypothetical protein